MITGLIRPGKACKRSWFQTLLILILTWPVLRDILYAFIKRSSLSEKSTAFGDHFEHFIFLELKAYQFLTRSDWELEFWRTHKKDEVDFVLGKGEVIIEVKASSNPKAEFLNGLLKEGHLRPGPAPSSW